jgi:hypothetical protein
VGGRRVRSRWTDTGSVPTREHIFRELLYVEHSAECQGFIVRLANGRVGPCVRPPRTYNNAIHGTGASGDLGAAESRPETSSDPTGTMTNHA